MGKDKALKGAAGKSSSEHQEDQKELHVKLVNQERQLSQEYEQVKAIFQNLEKTYQDSKGTFSVQRYGQLKSMIKTATSDETVRNIQAALQASEGGGEQPKGMAGLLMKAKEFSGESESQQQQAEAQASSGKPKGKMSSFMKKLKNMTGFSEEPITDEDVMSTSELERDNARKERSIRHYKSQFSRAVTKLQKLKQDYEASKSHAPPKRYQELKDMIKVVISDKLL